MSKQVLSIAFRPQSFKDLVGCDKLVKILKGHHKSGRMPQAFLFSGPTGVGKTTVARIVALSLQCTHQEFGSPCVNCQNSRSQFNIMEVNASDISGVDDMRKIADTAHFFPVPPSKYRIIILDEAHQISKAGQNLLLKHFEDCPVTSFWMICTTDSRKIISTLRSRCTYHHLGDLKIEEISKLVQRALKFLGVNKSPDDLVSALWDNHIFGPRLILNATEKWLAGAPPKDAAQVEMESEVDTLAICRSVTRGDWKRVCGSLKELSGEDAMSVTYALSGYLKSIVLQPKTTNQVQVAAQGIRRLAKIAWMDEGIRSAALIAELHLMTAKFGDSKFTEDKYEETEDDDDED